MPDVTQQLLPLVAQATERLRTGVVQVAVHARISQLKCLVPCWLCLEAIRFRGDVASRSPRSLERKFARAGSLLGSEELARCPAASAYPRKKVPRAGVSLG